MSTSRPSSSSRPAGRRLSLVLLLVAASLAGAAPAAAGIADQVGATFGLMLQDVVGAFPPIEGLVVSVEADRLYVDLGQGSGAQPGQELTVFRKGEVFRHPATGRPLGRYEDVLGYAQIRRVFPAFAEAAFIPLDGRPAPRAEDGVRITRARIRVAVAPALDLARSGADLRRVPFMLAFGLDQTKRFQSADPGAVQERLLAQRTKVEELLVRPEKAVAVGRTLEVAGWLVPMLLERRGVVYLDVTWISAVTGTPLFSRRMALVRPDTAAEQRFPWEPVPED